MPFYERQPYIQPLYLIVSEVMRGDIRVPRFQRAGTETTWSPDKRGDLLDSLHRGFPIGTILLWSTTKRISTFPVIGGFQIPEAPSEKGQRLLLDGHQRLSTLVQILGPGLNPDVKSQELGNVPLGTGEPPEEEHWVFELQPSETSSSSRERFVLLKPNETPSPTQLPLATAMDRKELNRWIREPNRKLSDTQIAEADALRDRLREYSIPVAVLVADSLEDATESFKRINSSGVQMSDFNMVAALAYRDGFDPQEIFDQHRSELLEPLGWKDARDQDILRVCAGLAEQHPAKLEVDQLANRLREDPELLDSSFRAMAKAAELIGTACGIHGPEALPYTWQLITLAIWLGGNHESTSKTEMHEAVRQWIWLTTYGEVFAGVNSAIYDRSNKALRDMTQGRSWDAMERDITKKVRAVDRFDFRAARSKAVALAMARHQDQSHLNGPAHRALAAGRSSMALLLAKGKRSTWWHLVVVPQGESIAEYRSAVQRSASGKPESSDNEVLAMIGIRQDKEPIETLLEARRNLLIAEEREFTAKLGLES